MNNLDLEFIELLSKLNDQSKVIGLDYLISLVEQENEKTQ